MYSARATPAFYTTALIGCMTVVGLTISAGSPVLGILVVGVLPLVVFLVRSRDLVSAAALLWLNEQFFGMAGTWATLGPIPGRGIVLLGLLVCFLTNKQCLQFFSSLPKKTHYVVIGYGVVLPLALLIYAAAVMGNGAGGAASDVIRFFGLLAFYPLAYVYRRSPNLLLSAISAGSITLSLIFLFMSIGPYSIRWIMVDNWVFNGLGSEHAINYYRVTYEPIIYGYIGSFVGVLMLLTPARRSVFTRASLMTIVGLLPTALNFLRGLLGSLALVVALLLLSKLNKRGYSLKVLKYLPLFIGIFAVAVFLILQNPFAVYKLEEMQNAISMADHFGSSRSVQIDLTLKTWYQYPIFGEGVGSPLKGYSLWKELSIEFQWGMVLYRTGIVGLLLILVPFLFLVRYLMISKPNTSMHYIYAQSIACTLLTVALASIFNPYLASSVTVTLFVLYLAIRTSPPRLDY